MLRFLTIFILLLSTENAFAQTHPGTAPTTAGSRASSAPENPQENAAAELTRISTSCVRPGDVVTIEGKNLNLQGEIVPAFKIGMRIVPFKMISRNNERMIARLPKDVGETGKIYKIVLAHKSRLSDYLQSKMDMRFCADEDAHTSNSGDLRDILIFSDSKEKGTIIKELANRGIVTLRIHDFNAIDGSLIVIHGSTELLEELRGIFPNADIDENSDLFAAKGPRLYAKEKIKWPDKSSCVDQAIKIPIGLIDGAIDISHPAFAGQHIFEQSFLGKERADEKHATSIASILLGNAPDQGFDGLLSGVPLYDAVALRDTSDDRQLASIEAVLGGLDWLMAQHVRLINVSLAGRENRVLSKAFQKALGKGVLIFAAAGNNGPQAPPVYPAALEGVFAVTAIDAADHAYKAANTGSYIDFAAPGVDVWTAQPGGSGAYVSGTSYAAPYVLAVSALYLTKNPSLPGSLLNPLLKKNSRAHITANCP